MYLNILSFYTEGGLQDCVFLRELAIYAWKSFSYYQINFSILYLPSQTIDD